MASTRTATQDSLIEKKYLEKLSSWDSRLTPLAPLTEQQKASVVELNTLTQRPIPEKVRRVVSNNY